MDCPVCKDPKCNISFFRKEAYDSLYNFTHFLEDQVVRQAKEILELRKYVHIQTAEEIEDKIWKDTNNVF